jgi:DNA invertase Pin-like site-specific DNA recombinase
MTTTAQSAFGFIRVSTGSQDAKTQRTRITGHAAAHGIHLVTILDAGTASASKGEQVDELENLIKRLSAGEASAVLVTETNRLDRREDLDSQIRTLMDIKATGAVIISLKKGEEDFGKNDPIAWQFTIGRMIANAEKSLTVKYETWGGVQAIIANKSSYGPLPVFWEVTGERYAKVASCTSPGAVKAIYEHIRNGHSLGRVAREFDTYPASIKRLIRTRANMTGVFDCHYTYQGQTYAWQHTAEGTPPVDVELWNAANRVIKERGESMNNLGGRPVSQAVSWLSGLLACPGCGGHLYIQRGKTLRCGGKLKDRRSCEADVPRKDRLPAINLASVTKQIEAIVKRDDVKVYRYQRVSGNQGELDELKGELDRVRQTLATTDDDDAEDRLVARKRELRDMIASFDLVPDAHEMTPTGETLAELWETGDKREIFKALQRYLSFYFIPGKPELRDTVLLKEIADYPDGVLIELSDDICVKFPAP